MGLPYFSMVNCHQRAGEVTDHPVDWSNLAEAASFFDKVVALGNFPHACLKKIGVEHFTLPHPSYRNRKLNDPDFEERVLEECRRYVHGDTEF